MHATPRRRIARAIRAIVGLAAWLALPLVGRRGLAVVDVPRDVLDPMVPLTVRAVATGAAALLACWACATVLLVFGPLARRTVLRGRRADVRRGGARTPADSGSGRVWAARTWLATAILGAGLLATRTPAVAAPAVASASTAPALAWGTAPTLDARSPRPVASDAASILACGIVASAVLAQVHRARLAGASALLPAQPVVPAVGGDPSRVERAMRRHVVSRHPEHAPTTRDPWSAVPVGRADAGLVAVDLSRGGGFAVVAPDPVERREVAAALVTALAGTCGFTCDVTASDARAAAIPSLVPITLESAGAALGDASAVRVRRRTDGIVLTIHLGVRLPDSTRALVRVGATWCLEPGGTTLQPFRLTSADASGVAQLATTSTPRPGRRAWTPPDDWCVVVRTMGPVTVERSSGEEIPFARPKSIELLAWLTHHRERPTRVAARTALWSAEVSDATMTNVVSDARRSLARALDLVPVEWIARTYTERLEVDRRIVSDVDLLEAAYRATTTDDSPEAIARLDAALALVRDLPFAGSDYLWPDEEGLTSHAVHLIVSAARRSARWHLDRDDPDAVVTVTGHGLRALRGDEDLLALRAAAMRPRSLRDLAARGIDR